MKRYLLSFGTNPVTTNPVLMNPHLVLIKLDQIRRVIEENSVLAIPEGLLHHARPPSISVIGVDNISDLEIQATDLRREWPDVAEVDVLPQLRGPILGDEVSVLHHNLLVVLVLLGRGNRILDNGGSEPGAFEAFFVAADLHLRTFWEGLAMVVVLVLVLVVAVGFVKVEARHGWFGFWVCGVWGTGNPKSPNN